MNDEKIMPNPQFPYEETLKYIKLAQSGDREAMNSWWNATWLWCAP